MSSFTEEFKVEKVNEVDSSKIYSNEKSWVSHFQRIDDNYVCDIKKLKINFVVGAALRYTFECQQSIVVGCVVVRQFLHSFVPPIVQVWPFILLHSHYHIDCTDNGHHGHVGNGELQMKRKENRNCIEPANVIERSFQSYVIGCNEFRFAQERLQKVVLLTYFGRMLINLILAQMIAYDLSLCTRAFASAYYEKRINRWE